jgi:hypothetical protein
MRLWLCLSEGLPHSLTKRGKLRFALPCAPQENWPAFEEVPLEDSDMPVCGSLNRDYMDAPKPPM